MKAIACAALLLALVAGPAGAVKTSTWATDDVNDFLKGDAAGVTIQSDGQLRLGLSVDTLVSQLEGVTFIWSLARSRAGAVYFGTGDNGSIYRWAPGGKATLVWNTGAGEITALAVDAQDNLYAGSAPGGIVFRVSARGDTTRYFQTGEESVWSLLAGADGALYVGTGSHGKIFRVTGAGQGSLFAETRDVNVLTMAETKEGALLAGTGAKGLLWRIERNGGKRVIFDSDSDELRAVAVLSDGSIAVAANRVHGSGSSGGAGSSGAGGGYGIDVTPGGGGGGTGGRCAISLVRPDGSSRLLYTPPSAYVYSLTPGSDRTVIAATGEPAGLFEVGLDRRYSLLFAPDAKQIISVLRSTAGMLVATSNAASLVQLGPGTASEGTYLSEAKDLRSVATWGRVMGRMTGGGDVVFSSRSGLGNIPDDGWSAWSKERPMREGPVVDSPPARYLQYRLTLKGSASQSPALSSVEVAYQQENLPPEISNVRVYGPSTPFIEGSADYRPPQLSQTFPDGMKLDYSIQRSGPRQVPDAAAQWVRGIRSVVWDATDPNGDDLSYKVSIKAEGEKEWYPLGEETSERAMAWDSQAFANGTYRIRVVASDKPDNPAASALEAERVSPPFEIDNIPPRLEGLSVEAQPAPKGARGRALVRGVAIDADTRIGRIEYSVDGGDWKQVLPIDGIFDSLREEFRFEVPDLATGVHAISVRASDAHRNMTVSKVLTVTR